MYCIASNVVDFRTYRFPSQTPGSEATARQQEQRIQHDYNALSPADRQHLSYIRGLALNLVEWINCNIAIAPRDVSEYDVTVDQIVGNLLLTDMQALLGYRIAAEGSIVGSQSFTYLDMKRQVELLFFDDLFGWGPDNFEHDDRAARDVFFAVDARDFAVGMYPDPNEFNGE